MFPTYVKLSVGGGWAQVEGVWAMHIVCVCVQGRSCQGLIECLYMTSSCWGLGCALGKVENNERRTAAKHNRIHLYLPTAAYQCGCVCQLQPRPLHPQHTQHKGRENRFSQSCTRLSFVLFAYTYINCECLNNLGSKRCLRKKSKGFSRTF